jgi:transcriptional regulator with XRE-family HTH domain
VVVVDNRKDTRDFLVSRRARITPEKARLPAYGRNRRVPGLRREEVALLAGVSVDYYTRMERGNLNGVSESVLEALAANRLGQALYAPLIDSPARPANSARFVFLDPRDRLLRRLGTRGGRHRGDPACRLSVGAAHSRRALGES